MGLSGAYLFHKAIPDLGDNISFTVMVWVRVYAELHNIDAESAGMHKIPRIVQYFCKIKL